MSDQKIKVSVFCCTSSIDDNSLFRKCNEQMRKGLKVVGLPCSGKINLPYLVKAFEKGADGVLVVTCQENDCRFLEGNFRAEKRGGSVDDLLEEIGLGRGRIEVIPIVDGDIDGLVSAIEKFQTKLSSMPKAGAGA